MDPFSASRSLADEKSRATVRHILVVEDNEADVFLITEAIREANLPVVLDVARNGEQATMFFDRADSGSDEPCPALMILDINLPRKPGFEVLRHMRRSRRCGSVPVIVVSTSDSEQDRARMNELGADGYFRKPSEYHEFMKLGQLVKGVLGAK
jgi:DNA-binding response OmpR family regulator